MGGKNMAYVMGPLQMAAGAGLMATGAGAPIGIPLLTAGAGETIGKAAGGSSGAGMGEMFGGLAGGLGEGFGGMGPLSGMLGPGSSIGEGARGMFGMGPSGVQQAQDVVSGATQMPSGFPGGQSQWDLLKQSFSGLGQQEGFPNMPSFTATGPAAPGTASLGGNPIAPTSPAAAAASSSMPSLSQVSSAANIASKVTQPPQQSQPAPPTPGFKGPISQSPVSSKGQAPATAVSPTVTNVPQAPSAPVASGGRRSQEDYLKLLQSLSSGNMGVG